MGLLILNLQIEKMRFILYLEAL